MNYGIHPAADIFPAMSESEYEALKADIAANGLRQPLIICDGVVLDGRHRLRACNELGIAPETVTRKIDDPVALVLSLNLARRHLDATQRAVVAVEVERVEAELARQRQATSTGGACPQLTELIPEAEKGEAREKAANAVGSNPRYVSDAKKIARDNPHLFQQMKSGEKTIADARREETRKERVEKLQSINKSNEPLAADRKYPVLYADPPWRYEHSISVSREIENQYPTMHLDAIKALPVNNVAYDDCVLFMWATSPKLAEALSVVDAWGFTYRTCAVWDKRKIGMGYYFRQQHELLLVCTRGKPVTPLPENRPGSVFTFPREAHSAKPDEFYAVIEAMYPEIPKLELFARTQRDGWDSWGNEAKAA